MSVLPPGNYENELFYNCEMDVVKGVTLKGCTLLRSRLKTKNIEDALGFTVTLDCKTFEELELSPLMFDLLCVLLIKTKGNTEKRKRLIDILGNQRLHELLSAMGKLNINGSDIHN